jgi:hypothetical protein
LVVALKRWCQLCGQGELYPQEELGFEPLVGAPEIFHGRSLAGMVLYQDGSYHQ